jgi:hypothetical protein
MMNTDKKSLQDGGLRARTSVKDEFSKQTLKHQLMVEIETLSQRLQQDKGARDTTLQQTYKSMIQARQDLLKLLP